MTQHSAHLRMHPENYAAEFPACDLNVDARAWLDWSGSHVKVAIEDAALQHSHNEAHRRMFADGEAYRCGADRVDIGKRASCKAQS